MAENKKLDQNNIPISESLLQKVLDDKTIKLLEKNSKLFQKSLTELGDSIDTFSGKDFEKVTGVGEVIEGLSKTQKVKSAKNNIETLGDSLDKFESKSFTDATGVGEVIEGLSNKFKVVSAVDNIKYLGNTIDKFHNKNFNDAVGVKDIIDGLWNPFKVVLAKNNITLLGKTIDKFHEKDYSNAVGVKDIIDGLWNPFKVELAKSNIEGLGDTLDKFEKKDYSGATGVKDIIDGLWNPIKFKFAKKHIKDLGSSLNKFSEKDYSGVTNLIESLSSPLKMMKSMLGMKLLSSINNPVNKIGSKSDVLGDTAALEEQQRDSKLVQTTNDIYTEVQQNQLLLREIKGDVDGIIPSQQIQGFPTGVKEDEEGFGLLGNLGLITTALAGALGVYLAKEFPDLSRGLKMAFNAGRTLEHFTGVMKSSFLRFTDTFAGWSSKITGNLTKWGDDILSWGSKLWKVVKGGLEGIPIVGKLFSTVGKNLPLKGIGKIAGSAAKVGKGALGSIFKVVLRGMKTIGKKLPIVGLGMSLYNAWDRWPGDKKGAILEVISGAASLVPGLGSLVSVGIDAYLAGKDGLFDGIIGAIVPGWGKKNKSIEVTTRAEAADMGNELMSLPSNSVPEPIPIPRSKVTPEQVKKQVDEDYQNSDSQIITKSEAITDGKETDTEGIYEKFNAMTEQFKALAGLIVATKEKEDKIGVKMDSSTPSLGSAQQLYYNLMFQS